MKRSINKGSVIVFNILMLILLSGIAPDGRTQPSNNIKFKHVFETGGYNFDIVQDREGFIWVGTINGVRVFDGYEVKSYTASENTFPTNNIRTVFVDSEGLVWLATFGGLAMYDKETDTFSTYLHDPDNPGSISSSEFNGSPNLIAESEDGLLWFGTVNGLNSYDKKTKQFTHYLNDPEDSNTLGDNDILSVYSDKDGFIWIGTKEGGLNQFNPRTKNFTHYTHNTNESNIQKDIGAGEVNAIVEDADGSLWIGTSKSGLKKFDKETETFTHYQHNSNDPKSLANNNVRVIVPGSDGSLWICHPYWVTVGIERFDRNNGTFYQYKHDPQNPDISLSDRVQVAFEDESGILWVGQNLSTVSIYDKHLYKFNLYKSNPGDNNSVVDNVIAIVEDGDKNIWLGSGTEGLARYNRDSDNFTTYPPEPEFPDDKNLTSMHVDSSGNFWITTNKGILGLYDTKTGTLLKRYHHPKLVEAWSMLEDPQNPETLWFATENSGVFNFNKKTEKFTRYEPDVTTPALTHLLGVHADKEGHLWFTSESNGLIRYDRKTDSFRSYRHNDNDPKSISSNNITYFYVSTLGSVWVSSQKGLNKFDKDTETFTTFGEKAGIHSTIRGIIEDDNGFLWISSDSGLLKFDTIKNRVVRTYEEGGLAFNFSPLSFLRSSDGEMWFSSSIGVIRFDPNKVKDNPVAPPVYLTSITQGGEKIETGMSPEKVRKIELDWQHNFFEFTYIALNYIRSEKNQYAYMLEGFDKEWYNAGRQRFGRYSGLPGGQYTLRVKGSNNDGVWNHEGASLIVNVAAPWWKTKLFFWSIGSLAVLFILCAYLLRVQAIKNRNLELEKRVNEKTWELQEALDNIKTLTGLIPICSNCKKIRDDSGYWGQVEDYISKHSEAEFSHSICPGCIKVLYPDFAEEVIKKIEKKNSI